MKCAEGKINGSYSYAEAMDTLDSGVIDLIFRSATGTVLRRVGGSCQDRVRFEVRDKLER